MLSSMVKTIEQFNKEEQLHLLELVLTDGGASYSENNNGTFIKMETLSAETLQKMADYIQYVEKKEKDIYEGEIKMNEIKKDLNL